MLISDLLMSNVMLAYGNGSSDCTKDTSARNPCGHLVCFIYHAACRGSTPTGAEERKSPCNTCTHRSCEIVGIQGGAGAWLATLWGQGQPQAVPQLSREGCVTAAQNQMWVKEDVTKYYIYWGAAWAEAVQCFDAGCGAATHPGQLWGWRGAARQHCCPSST